MAVLDALAWQVGVRCSNPGCKKPTSGPRNDSAKAVNVGVGPHITAASAGGPRYDPTLSKAQQVAVNNGIGLCQTCAKLIDGDPALYTVVELRE